MSSRHLLLATAALLAVVACTPGANVTSTRNPGGNKITTTEGTDKNGRKITVGEVRGFVVGPKGYKAGKPAPVPGATAYGLSQAEEDEAFQELPIEGVQVYLASRKGERFKGPTVATTNLKGEFVIKNVPLDLSFLVMTNTNDPEQRHKELCGITQTVKTAGEVKISYASTLVTLNTLQNTAGNALGQLSNTIYLQLNASVEAQLKTMKLSAIPDVSKPEEIQAFMATVTVNGKPASALVDDLRGSLAQNGVDAASVQKALDQLDISFIGAGSATVNGQTTSGGTAGTITLPPDLATTIFGPGGGTAQPAPASEPPAPEPTASQAPEPSQAAEPDASPAAGATASPDAEATATPTPAAP